MDTNLLTAVDDLFLDSLAEGKDVRLHVDGTSMVPSLKPGDTVVLQRVEPGQLQIGDLVVVRREHDMVTHRLVHQDAGQWLMKGDNCRYLDPPASGKMILGRVITVERSGTVTNLQGARWRFVNRWLAGLSWLEAAVFRFGHKLRGSSPGNGAEQVSVESSMAARLVSLPFRLLIRFLVR